MLNKQIYMYIFLIKTNVRSNFVYLYVRLGNIWTLSSWYGWFKAKGGIYCCPAPDFLIASFLYWNAYNPLINWKYLPWSKSTVLSQSWEAPLQHSARREKWEKVRNTSKSMENSQCGSLSLEAFPDMSKSNSTAASVSSDERTGPTHAAGGCQCA